MKHKLLLSVFVVSLLASCSTAYKSGQTPDDVYFSPARAIKEDVKEQYTSADDNYLRMKVHNYNRWNFIDDYSYWYDTRYDFQCNYNSYYSAYYIPPYYSWTGWYHTYQGSSFYNPCYQLIPYKNPTYYGSTSASNITAYNTIKGYNNINISYNPKTGSGSTNNGNNFGGLVKRAFSSNPSSSSSWDTPARTFDSKPSSSSSSSTSSSAGGKSGGFGSTGSSSSGGRGGRN